jgi:UDP-N-acetyl-D-galactosamine dehydrogenase
MDVISRLKWLGHSVEVADALADEKEVEREYGIGLTKLDGRKYDLVIGAVAHDAYRSLTAERLEALVAPQGTLADLKGMWLSVSVDPAIDRWSL